MSAALTAPASAATTVTTAATTATAGTLAPAAAATTVAHTYELPHLLATATWGVKDHLQSFYQEFLPADMAKQAADLVNEFYRLSFRRKPEFMGNTREEEEDAAWRQIKDLPFSAELTAKLIAKHQAQLTAADDFFSQVPAALQDCVYEFIVYPVKAGALLSLKMLTAMEDRHNGGDFSRSDAAFDEINALTRRYNSGFHNNGKFNKMMDAQPRLLPVFDPLRDRRHAKTPLPAALQLAAQVNGSDFTGTWALPGLGYKQQAAFIPQQGLAQGRLPLNLRLKRSDVSLTEQAWEVQVHFLPTFSGQGESLRVKVSLLDTKGQASCARTFDLQTHGRSERWKENVLNNRTSCVLAVPPAMVVKLLRHGEPLQLTIAPLDDGVILDEVYLTLGEKASSQQSTLRAPEKQCTELSA